MPKRTIIKARAYNFKDKDPIIDQLRTAIQEEGMSYPEVAEVSGVTVQTLYNWFNGDTKKPQHATVMCVVRGIGRDMIIVRSNKIVRLKRA